MVGSARGSDQGHWSFDATAGGLVVRSGTTHAPESHDAYSWTSRSATNARGTTLGRAVVVRGGAATVW